MGMIRDHGWHKTQLTRLNGETKNCNVGGTDDAFERALLIYCAIVLFLFFLERGEIVFSVRCGFTLHLTGAGEQQGSCSACPLWTIGPCEGKVVNRRGFVLSVLSHNKLTHKIPQVHGPDRSPPS